MSEFQRRLIERSGAPPKRWKTHVAEWLGISRPTLDGYLDHAAHGRLDRIPETVLARLEIVPDDPDSQSAAPSFDEMLLAFASGLVALQEEMDAIGHPRAPYPAALQRGLDIAAAINWRENRKLPVTLADLLRVAATPIYKWCPDLAGPLADQYYAASLLEDFEITRDCLSLSSLANQDEELVFYRTLMECCEELGTSGQTLYEQWRRTVIEAPIATGYTQLLSRHPTFLGALSVVQRLIDTFYARMPPVHAQDGKIHLCPLTRTRLRRVGSMFVSELRDEAAVRALAAQGPRVMDYTPDVLELRRPARLYWTLPGWHELQLAKAARDLGWDVDLWPKLDTVDLVLRKKGNPLRYAVDVKDHMSPQGLARSFDRFTAYKSHVRLIVIPDYLAKLNPEYRTLFERFRASQGKQKVDLVIVSEFLNQLESCG